MTESQIRSKVVEVVQGWVGATKGSAKHREIVTIYNGHKPLARSYALQVSDAYCAATVSAAWIKAGVVSICVTEVSAPKMVTLAQQKGIWVENDAYVPKPGDVVAYDWQDGADYAKTDNRGSPDHVGIVEYVDGSYIHVIEGNMSGGMTGRRKLAINGRYIRGFICPPYSKLATEPDAPAVKECTVKLPVLSQGSNGNSVRVLQKLLGYLTVDGAFGPATAAAVRNYQMTCGLTADGVVGTQTWTRLLK